MVVSKRFTSTFLLKESSVSTHFFASVNSVRGEHARKGGQNRRVNLSFVSRETLEWSHNNIMIHFFIFSDESMSYLYICVHAATEMTKTTPSPERK